MGAAVAMSAAQAVERRVYTSNNDGAQLCAAITAANPGDTIVFDESGFPSGSVTPITLTTALPTLTDAGLVFRGDGRVAIACDASMTTGNGLTIAADNVVVTGTEVKDCPDHGIQVTGHGVSAMIRAVLLVAAACAGPQPGPDRVPDPGSPFADCPVLDFLLPISGPGEQRAERVVGLADGDVIVSGDHYTGDAFGTGPGDRLPDAAGGRSAFVARLGPDGALRWAHTVSGVDTDSADGLDVSEAGIWLSGTYTNVLFVDREAQPGTVMEGPGAFGALFALDGTLLRTVTAGSGSIGGGMATSDPDGNVYLAGDFMGDRVTLAGLTVEATGSRNGLNTQDLFVASFGAAGAARWLTAVGDPTATSTTGCCGWTGACCGAWSFLHSLGRSRCRRGGGRRGTCRSRCRSISGRSCCPSTRGRERWLSLGSP